MGTNRKSKAILALGGAGLNAEAVHGHLTTTTTGTSTAFLDGISVTGGGAVTVADSGFEAPALGASSYVWRPSGAMFHSTGNAKACYTGIKWDGRNVACDGIWFDPQCISIGIAECPLRIYNNAFLNFTGVGLNFLNRSNGEWSGQADIWNCLFYNCAYGSQIGVTHANDYEYLFEGCEFEYCDYAIDSCGNTAQMVYDTHFDHSTYADMISKTTVRARHCTSTFSKAFLAMPQHTGGGGKHVLQDCWVDAWTNAGTGIASGAIQIGDRSASMIFDCKFTNPPNARPPINMINNATDVPNSILVSNNSCTGYSDQSLMVQTGSGGGVANVLPVNVAPGNSNVGITTSATSANYVFLESGTMADSTHILDVTQAPYNAAKDFSVDATAAIQSAINDAIAANNGSIVYLPVGYYKISSALNISGANYAIEGGGYWTHLCWAGTNGGTMLSVTTPSNITLRDFVAKVSSATLNTATITVSGTGPSSLMIDNFYHRQYTAPSSYTVTNYVYDVPGIVLNSLPAGSLIYFGLSFDSLAIHDCGAAEIFGNHMGGGRYNIDGANNAKTGFLGFLYTNSGIMWLSGSDTGLYDINVKDNQDLVMADFYNEQTYNNLNMEGGSATWDGRVTIQGFKRDAWQDNTAINVNNYKGRLFYGPQTFYNNRKGTAPTRITQTGTNAIDLILPLNNYYASAPSISTGTACHLIQQYNAWNTTSGTWTQLTNVPSPLSTADYTSMAAGLDHLRQLGLEDLKLLQGIGAAPLMWTDTFAGATGSGSDVLAYTGTAGAYMTGTLTPTSDSASYRFYYKGTTAFTVSLTAKQNAVGSEAGLVFANTSGSSITTNYGGYTSSSINMGTVMGWTPGSITTAQVGALVLTFDYVSSGFPSNQLAVGLASGTLTLKQSYPAAGSLTSGTFAMSNQSAANIQAFTDNLNASGGILSIPVIVPAGMANAGASFGVANLLLQ